MKKVLIILIIIVLCIGGYFIYNNTDLKDKINGNDTDVNQIDMTKEKESLSTDLEDIYNSLGLLAIYNSVHNYNDGGDYKIDTNKNLLANVSDKQLFVMEQIVSDTSLDKNFIILDSEGKVVNEDMSPRDQLVTVYYKYQLFNDEYQKYFSGSFDNDNREVSKLNNKYDNDKNYIYYNNKKLGLNGVNVTNMKVMSIDLDNDNVYNATIEVNYSDRAKELLKIDKSNASIRYTRNNNKMYLVSFEIID